MNAVTTYQPRSFGELEAFCQRITRSAMVPPSFRNKPEDAAVAVMFGAELGLQPLTSLQFISVINGRPGVYSDAMPGLAFAKGMIVDMQEAIEGEGDQMVATCTVTRASGTKVTQSFSVAEAKKAGLWGKSGPWSQYSRRMLQWRARSWAIRDAAPHLFFGPSAEELKDIEIAEVHRGPDKARDITPQQAQVPGATPTAKPARTDSVSANTPAGDSDMKQLVHVVDKDGEVLAATSVAREASERYRAAKASSTDPGMVAVANLPMLRALLPYVKNGNRERLLKEIEAAEALKEALTAALDGEIDHDDADLGELPDTEPAADAA